MISGEPKIIQLPALYLLGLPARFTPPMAPGADNLKVIPVLFARFMPMLSKLPPQKDAFIYGAVRPLSDSEKNAPEEREYLASINVGPNVAAQDPLVLWSIPASTYACFEHKGPIERLGATINVAVGSWLPRSEYRYPGTPTLNRLDGHFGDGGPACQLEFLLPIVRR